LQHYIVEHGKMPKVNQEMEDLFWMRIADCGIRNNNLP
jgi:hypothetical protein